MVGSERKSKEASSLATKCGKDIGRENSAPVGSTGYTKTVPARATTQAVFVGRLDRLVDEGEGTAGGKGTNPRNCLHGTLECRVDKSPIMGPARMTEGFSEADRFTGNAPRDVSRGFGLYFWGFK